MSPIYRSKGASSKLKRNERVVKTIDHVENEPWEPRAMLLDKAMSQPHNIKKKRQTILAIWADHIHFMCASFRISLNATAVCFISFFSLSHRIYAIRRQEAEFTSSPRLINDSAYANLFTLCARSYVVELVWLHSRYLNDILSPIMWIFSLFSLCIFECFIQFFFLLLLVGDIVAVVSLSGSFEVANIIHICVQYAHFIYIHFSRVVRFYSCSRIFFGSFCIFSKFQVTSFSTAQPNPNIVSCCSMICHSYIRTDF